MKLKLPFALKNGKLIEISDVKSGLHLDCFCPNPNCNSNLIARKGDKNIDHFAHYKNPDCKYGLETALHLAAKEILEIHKEIKIPKLFKEVKDLGYQTLSEEKSIKINEVILENKINNIIPDVIAVIGNKKLLIEIAVTHFIDTEKRLKIKKIGISTLEIDLSYYKDEVIDFKLLKEVLVDEPYLKKWIFCSREKELIIKKQNEINQKKLELVQQTDLKRKDFFNIEMEELILKRLEIKEENEASEKIMVEFLKKKIKTENWKNKLKNDGYKLLEIYPYQARVFDHGYYYNRGKWVDDGDKQENIYCPKIKENGKNKRIEIKLCKTCQFHHSIVYEWGDERNKIVCSYKQLNP